MGTLFFLVNLLIVKAQAGTVAFPKDFKWCTATSGHQIEGDNIHSDWWAWEQQPGKIKGDQKSGKATDHWNRVEEDADWIQWLGVSTYRMGVEWSRVEPKPGQWDTQALDHYAEEVRMLKARGIDPWITLSHFTLPQWVAERGGLEWKDFPQAFEAFTRVVASRLGADVSTWSTFNEPITTLTAGYMEGLFPPGQKRPMSGIREPLLGILRAHALSYRVIHDECAKHQSRCRVGMAHHLRVFDPKSSWGPLDRYATSLIDQAGNWAIPESLESGQIKISVPFLVSIDETIPGLKGTQDYFGLNYYSRDLVDFSFLNKGFIARVTKSGSPQNDLGWEIYPEGIKRLLREVKNKFSGRPILILENGVADSKDALRPGFIKDHLRSIKEAIDEGAPVESYCHWSLLDNFEWAEGFPPRFGLIEVDYSTFKRKPRASAELFKQIAEQNGFVD